MKKLFILSTLAIASTFSMGAFAQSQPVIGPTSGPNYSYGNQDVVGPGPVIGPSRSPSRDNTVIGPTNGPNYNYGNQDVIGPGPVVGPSRDRTVIGPGPDNYAISPSLPNPTKPDNTICKEVLGPYGKFTSCYDASAEAPPRARNIDRTSEGVRDITQRDNSVNVSTQPLRVDNTTIGPGPDVVGPGPAPSGDRTVIGPGPDVVGPGTATKDNANMVCSEVLGPYGKFTNCVPDNNKKPAPASNINRGNPLSTYNH